MTDEQKLEKVITALQKEIDEATYPDRPRKFMFPLELAEQALDVLKAQEARVMTLEEVAALPDGSIVWLEDNDKPDVIVGLLRDVLLTANDYTIVMAIHFATVSNQFLEVVTAMADDYGIRWRCWTSRPTDEQREAEPW